MLWNGKTLPSFHSLRGLRQSDLMAPYLFVLCIEVLGHQIQQLVDRGHWKVIRIATDCPPISHIIFYFFANNLLLMGESTISQGQVMEETLAALLVNLTRR